MRRSPVHRRHSRCLQACTAAADGLTYLAIVCRLKSASLDKHATELLLKSEIELLYGQRAALHEDLMRRAYEMTSQEVPS